MSSSTKRILIIDDDPGDFEMTRAMIQSVDRPDGGYQVEWASSWQEAAEAFQRRAHDVYLVDYFLEDRDGLAVVREARAMGVREPLIMLTGRGSREVDVEAMEAGASDYLVKGRIDPDLLERTVRYAIERFRSQQALLDSEERHRGMFDHLPLGLYRCAPDGGFLDANPALVRMLGHPDAAELADRFACDFYVAPEHRESFLSALEADGVVRGFRTGLHRSDGTDVRVLNTARAHRDAEGRVVYVEGVVEDLSPFESADRIRGRAECFDAIFAEARLAILLLDGAGTVVEANPAFRRVFGYAGPDPSGLPFSELGGSSDRDLLRDEIRALTKGEVDRVEVERRILAGDGALLWSRVQALPVTDAGSSEVRIVVLLDEVAEVGAEG